MFPEGPRAGAVVAAAAAEGLALPRVSGFEAVSGRGVRADVEGSEVGGDWYDAIPLPGSRVALVVGDVMGHSMTSAAIMGQLRTTAQTLAGLDLPPQEVLHHLDEQAQRLEADGKTVMFVATGAGQEGGPPHVAGLIAVRDQPRPEAAATVRALKELGVRHVVMLSGDNQGTVDVIARELGLSKAHGHMLPEDKSAYVKEQIGKGATVAFVGDGVNDSPSLATAQIGIAMGSGTEVAIETSNVVLMHSDFSRLPHALGLVKATSRNMIQNIVIAIGVVIALLASVLFGEWMNMSIGMLVHEGSILVVILNGMRLLRYRLKS